MEQGVGVGEEDHAEGVGEDVELLVDGCLLDVGEPGGEPGEGFPGEGASGFEQVVVDAEGEAFAWAAEVFDGGGFGGDWLGHGGDGRYRPAKIIPEVRARSATRPARMNRAYFQGG